jgi:flagellar biosynthetic protein FlhB
VLESQAFSLVPSPHSPFPIIHLQWFSDDSNPEASGRTEPPTEHKIQRLREEGQVVKSQELVGALGLFMPALMLLFLAPSMLRTSVEMVRFFFLRVTELDPTKDAIIVGVFLQYLARLALPILGIAVFSALFSNIVQVGFLFTTKPLSPDFSKVTPKIAQFFTRIFSVDGLYNFFKSIIKMAIVGVVGYILITMEIEKILNLQKAGLWLGLTTVASLAKRMILIVAALMLILAIPDYMFQRWRFRERNKMSRQEIKEEMKMYEADPQIQSRIRSRFRDLLKQNITAAVPRADVVITNPTHLAVALEYDQKSMPGPMVTAIGADEMSARIRKIAEENGVPLVEDKPLAWVLYRETDVGDIIPESYWNAVATVLSKVWRLNEDRRRKMSA